MKTSKLSRLLHRSTTPLHIYMKRAEYEAYEMTETDYLQVIKDGETGYIDADGRFTTDEDERYFNAAFD